MASSRAFSRRLGGRIAIGRRPRPRSSSRVIPGRYLVRVLEIDREKGGWLLSTKVAFSECGKPLSSAELSAVEDLVSPFKLPKDYRRFLLDYNGGTPDPAEFNWQHRTEGKQCGRVDELFGIDLAPFNKKRRLDCIQAALIHRDDLPRFSVPIGYADGHNILVVFTHGPREGEVWVKFWDEVSAKVDEPSNPEDAVYFVADRFSQFLRSLYQPADEYEPATFALDSPRVRGQQLEAILKSLGCKRFKYRGVSSSTPLPPAWEWPKFKRSHSRDPAFLTLEKNKVYGHSPRFDERPARHPMLVVDVTESQRSSCLEELGTALGKSARPLGR